MGRERNTLPRVWCHYHNGIEAISYIIIMSYYNDVIIMSSFTVNIFIEYIVQVRKCGVGMFSILYGSSLNADSQVVMYYFSS